MKDTGWSLYVKWTAAGIAAIGLLVLVMQKGPEVSSPPAPAPGASSVPAVSIPPSPNPGPSLAQSQPTESAETPQASFELLLQKARAALPEQGAFKQYTSEDVHAPPKPLAEAALALGDVAEAVSKDPALVPRAQEFYRDCALGNHPNTIRAFCLARARHHSPGREEPAWAAGLSDSVRELSHKVRLTAP